MTSTIENNPYETILALESKIKQELELVNKRLSLSSSTLQSISKKSNSSSSLLLPTSTSKPNAEEEVKSKKLQEEVLQQLGQLYSVFSSRSASAVSNIHETADDSRSNSQQQQQYSSLSGEAASVTPTNKLNDTVPPPRKGSPTPTFSTSHANQPSHYNNSSSNPQQQQGANLTPTARSGTPPPGTDQYNTNNSRSSSVGGSSSSLAGTPTSRSGSPSSSSVQRPPPPPAKGGMLWNYGLPSLMRSFKNTYVLIETDHVKWYKTEESYKNGDKEQGSVPLFSVQKNSRGSVIKNTAAGWPFIGPSDCPKATDSSRHYFGVQYFDAKNNLQHLVLAANSAEEKREWVNHIAQLIPLQLPPDAPTLHDGQLYIDMATNVLSHHCKKVLDGEAPKF